MDPHEPRAGGVDTQGPAPPRGACRRRRSTHGRLARGPTRDGHRRAGRPVAHSVLRAADHDVEPRRRSGDPGHRLGHRPAGGRDPRRSPSRLRRPGLQPGLITSARSDGLGLLPNPDLGRVHRNVYISDIVLSRSGPAPGGSLWIRAWRPPPRWRTDGSRGIGPTTATRFIVDGTNSGSEMRDVPPARAS
ncbi:hypothetical protein FMEAI12_6500064 [Parafrankia sp. Ea1.12]|nr:hypothetical protein FMEAI12_6500064 [Parafrankia sp. Ea1.12]